MGREKQLVFATPVLSAFVDDAARLNAALARLILDRRAADPGLSRSNDGGWHSGTDLLNWAGDAVRPVVAQMVAMADAAVVDLEARPGERRGWRLEAWANVNAAGAGNAPHSHGGTYWSGVYYVRIGEGEGGEIVLEDPRAPMIEMHAPFLRFRDAGGEGAIAIQPVEGQILLFPAWLRHSVRPWRGSGERISIAVNLAAPPLAR
jgi:uncharacterized protein (TIGR02466 family)